MNYVHHICQTGRQLMATSRLYDSPDLGQDGRRQAWLKEKVPGLVTFRHK